MLHDIRRMLRGALEKFRETLRPFTLGFAVLGVAAVIVAVAMTHHLRSEKKTLLARGHNYLSVVADLRAGSLADFHKERLKDLEMLVAHFGEFEIDLRVLRANPGRWRQVKAEITPLMARGYYQSLTLFDRRGQLIAKFPDGAEEPPPTAGPADKPRYAGLHTTKQGLHAMRYEARLRDGNRLVLLVRNDAWLSDSVQRWPGDEKTAEVVLFKREAHGLTALTNFRHDPESALKRRLSADADSIAARFARGETAVTEGRDGRGVTCLAACRIVPGLGWILVTKIDKSEALAPIILLTKLSLLAYVCIFGLLASIVVLFLSAQRGRLQAEANAEKLLLATAIEQAGESIVITDKNAKIIYTNPAFIRATGYTRALARGKTSAILKSGKHDEAFYREMWTTITAGRVWSGRLVNKRRDGTLFEEDAAITPVRDKEGEISHYIAVKRDISAVKSLEEQLSHSQKMEAVGRLAGGIAHDFNNILTTIIGYAEMLEDAAPPDSQAAVDLAEILGAGRRAALLTRQLLTFSRRAPAVPAVIDLRDSLRSIEKILRRTVGEDVKLTLELPDTGLWIKIDPGHVDQVMMNLAVNARDAMPHGGDLTLSADLTSIEAENMRALESIPRGRYVTVRITDTGTGMDAATQEHIFEPFFTTKEKGKGTGLGLATVFGIVKQNKGHISVDSAPGRGTSLTIYFPLVDAPIESPKSAALPAAPSVRGDETILVVEDQSEVLRLVSRALRPQGYHVIICDNGEQALKRARSTAGPIHLLLTDVVMPGMGGEELALAMRQLRPEAKVLYMSGYTDGRLDALGRAGEAVDLLLKPFTVEQICRRVREALDGAPPRVG